MSDPADLLSRELLNALRVGRLIDIIGTSAWPASPIRILDAGCGTGWLARSLASFGHQVDGIDPDELAILACRDRARDDGRDRYHHSTLADWAPGCLYEVVICTDALERLTDDPVGAGSLRNLGTLVRSRGRLIVAGSESEDQQRYADVLAQDGFTHRTFVRYGFRDHRGGFHVFDRTS